MNPNYKFATKVLDRSPTNHGYVIRTEVWPSLQAKVVPMTDDPDALANQLQDMIDQASPETIMTTCYTDAGDWIGSEKIAHRLCAERGIRPIHNKPLPKGALRPCSIGFCEAEQKWYGWSHRAICGFGVGSTVQKGDCAYVPSDMEDARQNAIRFWTEESHLNVQAAEAVDEDGRVYFDVRWTYPDDAELVPNEKLHGTTGGFRHYPPKQFGRGEWTALTLDDARQMAVDFAEGVG